MTNYEDNPKVDSIFRPAKNLKHKDDRWNLWHDDFKRKVFYKIWKSGLTFPVQAFIKNRLKKHDTWATDENIPKTAYNEHFWILRKSYENAFEMWFNAYYYQGYMSRNPDKKKFHDKVYNSIAQQQIRWIIDLLCTMAAEDTVYREMLAVWEFEHQKLMNKIFNPEIKQQHVFYCSYYDADPRYFQLAKEVGKYARMTPEYHEVMKKTQDKINADYLNKTTAEYLNKNGDINTEYYQKDVSLGDNWADAVKKAPNLITGEIKDMGAVITQIPNTKEGDIIIVSVPNAGKDQLEQLNSLLKEIYKGKGEIVIINKAFDIVVLDNIRGIIKNEVERNANNKPDNKTQG